MKLADCWKDYREYTEQSTAQSRKLGLVLGATCWFFRTPEASFPFWVLLSLLGLVVFFFLDLLQFLIASVLLRCWIRSNEKRMWADKRTIEEDVEKPWWLDRLPFACFILKIAALFAAFGFLVMEFAARL